MTPDEAAAALAEVAAPYQERFEHLYRLILQDLIANHGNRGLAWPHIQEEANLDGLAKVQGRAWTRTVEALWLDQCVEHGCTPVIPPPDELDTPDDT